MFFLAVTFIVSPSPKRNRTSSTIIAALRSDLERIMTDNKENLEIDLRELFGALLHRAWLIALVAVLGAALVFAYTYFMVVPLYQSSTLLYVNNSGINIGSTSFSISSGELNAAAIFLGAEEASYVTGQAIAVDGGYTCV